MDATIRSLERDAAADPGDGATTAGLARALSRAGRRDEARKVARARFLAREIDGEALALVLDLAGDTIAAPLDDRLPRANVGYVVAGYGRRTERLVAISPTVAFAGLPGAGATESALALKDLLGVRDDGVRRAGDETIVDFAVPLARPWVVARTYAVRSLRVVTIPLAEHLVKLRRLLLQSTSALAFVVDPAPGAEPRASRLAFRAVAGDFFRANRFPLAEIPLVVQYTGGVEEERHRELALSLGLPRIARACSRIDAAPQGGRAPEHEGVLETLAFLLAGVAASARSLAAPRPRPAV